jgi:hypothetical protein
MEPLGLHQILVDPHPVLGMVSEIYYFLDLPLNQVVLFAQIGLLH